MAELRRDFGQTNNNNASTEPASVGGPGEQVGNEGLSNPVPTLADLLSLLDCTPSGSESTDDEAPMALPGIQTVRSLRVVLKGGGPWGFTLCGGADVRAPLRVAEIEPGGTAEVEGSLQVGDCITSVNEVECGTITEAVQLIQSAFRTLTLLIWRGNVEPTTTLKSPAYLKRAREIQVREKPLAPQDDSIMYTESKHTLQPGVMKMKARQKPSRGESFCIGSVGKTAAGAGRSPLSTGAGRSPLSPHQSARDYENLQPHPRVDGSTGDGHKKQGQPFSQRPYKHLSQEDLLERSRHLSESTDALSNVIGARSGPLSPAKSTPVLSQAAMEDVVSQRHLSPSKPSFYAAKSSPNIHRELDVSVLGEPPKLVRPSVYADKRLNRPGLKFNQWSAWERDKGKSSVPPVKSSPRDRYRSNSPSQSRSYHNSKASPVNTYHPDTSFQPITEKDNYRRQSSQGQSDYSKHDYHNIDYSSRYNQLSAGYEPSDSGTSDSELEEPPAIPPPPPPESLLNPALYPPCSPPAPPVRDSATIKFCKVNQSHEKYPSWPVTAPSIRGNTDPSQPITSRAESWSDHTNTSSEFPRKQRMAYGPFQPNLRPLTEKNSPLAERKTEDGKSRNASDPGLKSDMMYHASVAKINDIGEERMKNFYNSQPGYPPPKYDSDGHNLGDKEYSVPSPPERDIPVSTHKLPPSNLVSPVPNQYHTRYASTDQSRSSYQSDHSQPESGQKSSPLHSPREASVNHSTSSQDNSGHQRSSSTNTEDRSADHYPPKRVDSRGYIVTPRPYYNTGTQTEVDSSDNPSRKKEVENVVKTRRAEVQVNDMASQTSPKRPDSLSDQWSGTEDKPPQTRLSWRSNDSDSGTGRTEGKESQTRRSGDSVSRRESSGGRDNRSAEYRQQNRNNGRRSEGVIRDYQRDFQYNERIRDIRERIGSNEFRNFDRGHPQNTHRKEENRETVPQDSRNKFDGAMNSMSPGSRTRVLQGDKIESEHLSREKPDVNKNLISDSDTQDVKRPSSGRSNSGRRSEPPVPLAHKQGLEADLEEDKQCKSDGSDTSLPSFHEYTPSTAPLLRMLSKEMYGQHIPNRSQYQHDKSLSFSSQENSSRSIGSPTPSSQYGNMKEAESYSSVLIYSDVSSGPFGRDDFGSQQSLGSQFSLLQEGKPLDYGRDRYSDKNTSSDVLSGDEHLSPRELRMAMRNKYSFDNTFHLMKQANQPNHRYTASESSPSNFSHNYVNTFDLEGNQQQLSPRERNSGQDLSSPSSSDQRPQPSHGYSRSAGQFPDQGGNSVIHKSHAVSASSSDLSHASHSQSATTRSASKSSEDIRIRSPMTNRTERQPSARTNLSSSVQFKKHSSSGSSSDQSQVSPMPSSSSDNWRQDESLSGSSGKLTRNETSSDLSAQSAISQSEQSSNSMTREEPSDSVFTETTGSISQANKPPQGRKRGGEKMVTRQESMKRAMGTFDEGERTLYTTTHLNKTSKSWNNLQDAKKDKVTKVPPRSQSYSNYQGLHSARSQSESNRLEQIKETSEVTETKSEAMSRGGSQPNLSQHSHSENSRQKKEPKTFNPKMWEDDTDVRKELKSKGSNLKRTSSEQIRMNKRREPVQGEAENVVTSKPPSNSGERRPTGDNQSRVSEVGKSPQQALLNFVERKKGRSMGSSSSQTSSESGSALSSPKALSKWPSTSSETMVKSIQRSESFSESTLSGGSDSRRHSTSSVQSQKEDRWAEAPADPRKDPMVKSSAAPAPAYAQEEHVAKAVRLEASAGALAPRPYKRPVPTAPYKSHDEDAPPALPPRNYRKFDEEQPVTTGNTLRRFSTEGRLDQTPQRRLGADSGKERFDSPREDAYVDRLRQEARRRLSEQMPNPARINLINSKPASYISHSVATQPTVPQEATPIPLGQENGGVSPTSTPTKPPAGPPAEYRTNTSQMTKDSPSYLTPLSIEEKEPSPMGEVTPPESSPDLPLPSPPRPTHSEEVDHDDLPPPPGFLMDGQSQDEEEELDGNRYPEGSYGSHKNNRSGARPFGSYQRSSSGPFADPTGYNGADGGSDGQGRPKRLGERAWRSVQSLPYQATSPTGTPSPDARNNRWLHAHVNSTANTSGDMSPSNTLPRVPPQRRVSDNFQGTTPLKTSTSFNTAVTCMSARSSGSRESLTNGDVDSSSPSVKDRVSSFERSKYCDGLNTSANGSSPSVNSENTSTLKEVKTKGVHRSTENVSNSVSSAEKTLGTVSKEPSRIESPQSDSRGRFRESRPVESPFSDNRGRYTDRASMPSTVGVTRGGSKDRGHVEDEFRGRYQKQSYGQSSAGDNRSRPRESARVQSPVDGNRNRDQKQNRVQSPIGDLRGHSKASNRVESPSSDNRKRYQKQSHSESQLSDNRGRMPSASVHPNVQISNVSATSNSAMNVNNVKRISVDNSIASPGRTANNSVSKPSPEVVAVPARPDNLVIVHRREKSREEEECERHAKLLAGQINDSNLSQVISPPFAMRSAMDYMNGLFEVTSPNEPQTKSTSSSSKKEVSPKTGGKTTDSNRTSGGRKSESPLPANSPYWISSAKAKLIERMRETDSNELKMAGEDDNIEQKKEELMERINQKLVVLQKARDDVQQDIDANNALGLQISETVEEKCKAKNEKEKYKSYIGDLEKIVRLLLKLSGLLARAENALSCLSPDAEESQRSALVDKRDHLLNQHEEAKRLKADIDRRRDVVAGFLKNYLNEEEIGDYMHFVEMKSRLTIEFQELEDKITLGQEQLQALKRSMPDDK